MLIPDNLFPPDLETRRVRVLAWTAHYFDRDFVQDFAFETPDGRRLTLEFTADRSRLASCDAIWFHAPHLGTLPERGRHQRWILASMESEVNCPVLTDPSVRSRFDVVMSYRLDSDVPLVYPSRGSYGNFRDRRPVNTDISPTGAKVLYIASNPVNDRDSYVAELMRYIEVDSAGACLNNIEPEEFVAGRHSWGRGGWESITRLMRRYKFYLAFENSIATDYVTERVFHALRSGLVPVYRGAPNIDEFLPSKRCIVNTADFDSPEHLAGYLDELDRDEDACNAYLQWKDGPFRESFESLLTVADVDPRIRMAVKLMHGCGSECRCGGRLRNPGGVVEPVSPELHWPRSRELHARYCGLRGPDCSGYVSDIGAAGNFDRLRYGDGELLIEKKDDIFKDYLRDGYTWEPHVRRWLVERIRPSDIVLDIGAHIGVHSLTMSRAVGSRGRVIAF
ncbi:MAG: hypothetical protein DWQ08_09575, partial [Proteobacteria bacterium]